MAINKVIYGNNTLMDITDTTAVATDVAAGKYIYTADGVKTLGVRQPSTDIVREEGSDIHGGDTVNVVATVVNGTKQITTNGTHDVTAYEFANVNVSNSDFIVTITKDQSNNYQLDCTFAELKSAYDAGKTMAITGQIEGVYGYKISYNSFNNTFDITFNEFASDQGGTYVTCYLKFFVFSEYSFRSNGTTQIIQGGNAQPSDVASGKTFVNLNGFQTGTASGGGSSNVVTGEFTVGSTEGVAETINISYTGSGYPVQVYICTKSSSYTSSKEQGAIGLWYAKKTDNDTPTYSASGNNNTAGCFYFYKNSSTANAYGRTAQSIYFYRGADANTTNSQYVVFKNNNTLSYFICNGSSRGLFAGATYEYFIIYST